jgi:hypothetical protein
VSIAYDLAPVASAALVTVAILATAGCGSLDRSVSRDHCATSSDCNPGRVCVAGVCQPAIDAGSDAPLDAPNKDAVTGVDLVPDLPTAGEASADALKTSPADAPVDGADAAPGGDVVDAPADAPADRVADAARDTGMIPPPDPCTTGPGQESPAATPALLAALPGLWRLCSTSVALDPDVSWLLSGKPSIQLDVLHWWRCTDGVRPSCDLTAQGLYFRVLEGPNSVFHFADQIDPFNGGGADLSIHYFAGSKLLQIAACDGVTRCSSNATYLALVGSSTGN